MTSWFWQKAACYQASPKGMEQKLPTWVAQTLRGVSAVVSRKKIKKFQVLSSKPET